MSDPSLRVVERDNNQFLIIENKSAICRISLFGGHVLSFIPKADNRDRLWLSPVAILNGERAIRGGIPLCWPWFGNDHGSSKDLPSHGILRTQKWTIESSDSDDGRSTSLTLVPDTTQGQGVAFSSEVKLHLVIGEQLTVTLETINTSSHAFDFNCALHSYLAVQDIHEAQIQGLTGEYKDKLDKGEVKQTPSPYTLSGQTDRIHQESPAELHIIEKGQQVITIQSANHDSIVVWNPWQSAASITDMDAFGYKHMLCVETAVTNGITLEPGETHRLVQTII
ncbi:D-hexose-6-phosphate mutarotase [Alteromonas gilva]|uniref:Putative glucose-6-phosphate 1-epimerase n=1 Tax=Alteromonas gilva TaxID=2987522 RepID=A0ABT5L1W6_9ALTE|nr:D-hexose-6-phosphate mutarotase [Alteromonas gilva]MDC8830867.1 D-hexose-6-phosphate mutarotase [Alteromonas gilva]